MNRRTLAKPLANGLPIGAILVNDAVARTMQRVLDRAIQTLGGLGMTSRTLSMPATASPKSRATWEPGRLMNVGSQTICVMSCLLK